MARIGAPGTGFSSADPRQSVDTFRGIAARRRFQNSSKGRSSRRTTAPRDPTVNVNGNIVTINGQGFSVAPNKQAEFIRSRTGGKGTSAQSAITKAIELAKIKPKVNELSAIQKKIAEIKRRGGRVKFKDTTLVSKTGRFPGRIIEYKKGSDLVRIIENKLTGKITYSQFGVSRAGGSVKLQKQVVSTKVKQAPTVKKKTKKGVFVKGDFSIKQIPSPKDIQRVLNSSAMPLTVNQGTAIQTKFQQEVKMGKVSAFIISAFDFLSGGYTTEKRIDNEQQKLNDRIIKFNARYNGKNVTQSTFNNAQAELTFIESEQKRINKKSDNLVGSRKNKVRNFYQVFSAQKNPRLTTQQKNDLETKRKNDVNIQRKIKQNQPRINNLKSKISQNNKVIASLNQKRNKSALDYLKLVRVKNQNNELNTQVARLKFEAPPKVLAGTFPIIPQAQISQVITKVKFIGTQKKVGDIIVSDIIFTTDKGLTGMVKGASVTKNGKLVSSGGVGHIGKVRITPSGKQVTTKLKTFVIKSKTTGKNVKMNARQFNNIGKFVEKERKSGTVSMIKDNLDAVAQAGFGRVAIVKGKKFFRPYITFPRGRVGKKLVRGISYDDFSSMSAVLSGGDMSAIVGKSITSRGLKSEFIGLVKNLRGASNIRLTLGEAQQYQQALKRLTSSMASAIAQAEKAQGLTQTMKLGLAVSLLKKTPTSTALPSRANVSQTSKKITVKTIAAQKITAITRRSAVRSKSAVKSKVAVTQKVKQLSQQISKQKSKLKQLIKTRSAQKSKQKQRIISKQISAVKQDIRSKTSQLTKLGVKLQRPTTTPTISRVVGVPRKPPIILIKLTKGFKRAMKRKKVEAYFVRVKRRGKIVRLNPQPLTLTDATDLLAHHLDNKLVRSGWFEPLGKTNVVVVPPRPIRGYFSRNRHKLRSYKIRVGKKKQIRNGYIEKTRNILDTRGERRQLSRAIKRGKKRRRTPVKRRSRSKTSKKKRR